MVQIDPDKHPGLYRYSIELSEYPPLTEPQSAKAMVDLRSDDGEVRHAALEKLICSHLGMVLAMAKHYEWRYEIAMEDVVGVGNLAMVKKAQFFNPKRGARFSTYIRKVVTRWVWGHMKDQVIWQRADNVEDIELLGVCDPPPDGRFWYLHKAMNSLNDFEREVIYFSFFDEYGAGEQEVAKTLRITLT